MRRLFLLLCICIVLSVSLSACGGNSNIKEAPYQDLPLVDVEGNDISGADAKQLYQAGHEQLVAGNPDEALRIFSEIQSRSPFTRYATQAALETATAYYIKEQYSKVVSTADRFIKQHPRYANVDYLYYLRGLANYHHNDPGLLGGNPDQRQLSYLRQAFADFRLLIRNFPNSVYASDARQHMIEIRNRLADFELTVAEYYLMRHAYVGAARRASYILRHYQRSTATPRALEIMQEAYIKLGLPALAQDARSILQASYPDYILHRREFYHPENKTAQANDNGPLAWLWPWSDEGEKDANVGHGWLEGKPATTIGQPDMSSDTQATEQKPTPETTPDSPADTKPDKRETAPDQQPQPANTSTQPGQPQPDNRRSNEASEKQTNDDNPDRNRWLKGKASVLL